MPSTPPQPPAKMRVDEVVERDGWRYTRLNERGDTRCEALDGSDVNEQELRRKLHDARATIRAKPAATRTPNERTLANLIAVILGDFTTPGD